MVNKLNSKKTQLAVKCKDYASFTNIVMIMILVLATKLPL